MKKDKVKICAVTTISKTMEWFVCDIMKTFSENSYDVTLICDMEEGFKEQNEGYAKCIPIKMNRGISIKDLITVPFRFRKIFKKNRFDVIYYMSPNASFYASLGGLLAGVPIRVYSQTGLRYVSFCGIKRIIFRTLEKLTCAFSTHIKSQSPKNRQFAIEEKLCNPDKVSVVGIGGTTGVLLEQCDAIDRENTKNSLREKYGIPSEAFLFGYVGRINADKGIGELIQAFEVMQNENDNVWLALVGMIDDANPIEKSIMLRAEKNCKIVFVGNVSPSEVYGHMAMFDVLTHPTYREGFGKVLQEAMGMRLPIITTNVPGPSEVVEDGISGILVPPKNFMALSEAMNKLYNDEKFCEKLAIPGRKRAETYFDRAIMLKNQLEDMNNIVNKIYKRLLK